LLNFIRIFRFNINRLNDELSKLDLFLNLTEIRKIKKLYPKDITIIEVNNLNFSYPNFAKEELKYLEIIERRINSYSSKGNYEKDQLHMIEEARKESKIENPVILENINISFKV